MASTNHNDSGTGNIRFANVNPASTADGDADDSQRRDRIGAGQRRRRAGFRHSRFVTWMRIALPAFAIILMATVVVWPQLAPEIDRFRFDLTAVGPTGGTKPQVLNPRLLGVDDAERPFQITADLGSQIDNGGSAEIYQLQQPKADITLLDGTWLAITADDGIFQKDIQVLMLTGNVNLFHDNGYEFTTRSARINLGDRSAEGDEPVSGQGPFGLLQAEGFRVFDDGTRVLFTGRARLTVFSSARPG